MIVVEVLLSPRLARRTLLSKCADSILFHQNGTYKVVDCRADGKSALCEPCPMGRFMNRDNQEEMCTWCSNCGPGEEVAHACSMDQDTVCRCTEGLSRDGNSGVCLPEEPHPGEWYPRHSLCPPKVDHEHEAVKLIRGNRDNLVDWIGVDPSPLLNHLKDSRMIPHDVHRAAKAMLGDECAELILNHFMNQGEMGCIQLWDALCSVRFQYEQLQQWILENVITNGAEHTELLLNNFIERGDDDCLKLLLALKAEQDQYPTLKKWLDSLGKTG
ncbi:unnamed protein product [Lampetra fluviatilis]